MTCYIICVTIKTSWTNYSFEFVKYKKKLSCENKFLNFDPRLLSGWEGLKRIQGLKIIPISGSLKEIVIDYFSL